MNLRYFFHKYSVILYQIVFIGFKSGKLAGYNIGVIIIAPNAFLQGWINTFALFLLKKEAQWIPLVFFVLNDCFE